MPNYYAMLEFPLPKKGRCCMASCKMKVVTLRSGYEAQSAAQLVAL